jgi:hypothetical protein
MRLGFSPPQAGAWAAENVSRIVRSPGLMVAPAPSQVTRG